MGDGLLGVEAAVSRPASPERLDGAERGEELADPENQPENRPAAAASDLPSRPLLVQNVAGDWVPDNTLDSLRRRGETARFRGPAEPELQPEPSTAEAETRAMSEGQPPIALDRLDLDEPETAEEEEEADEKQAVAKRREELRKQIAIDRIETNRQKMLNSRIAGEPTTAARRKSTSQSSKCGV